MSSMNIKVTGGARHPSLLCSYCSYHPPRLLPAEMAMAIEEADNGMRLSPIDDADSSGVEKDVEGGRDGDSKRGTQYSFDRPNMRYEDDSLIWMRLYQLRDHGRYTSMHSLQALATGRCESSIALPGKQVLSILRTTRHYLAAAQSLPRPKVSLT